MSRTVTLVLVDPAGVALGALPPFDVAIPWWSSTADIVTGARERFGLNVTVLRLLGGERPTQPGGAVTYVAQADRAADALLQPVTDELRAAVEADDPLRADYARPGGPQTTLAWASAVLREHGRGPVIDAILQRSWNLSAVWRLETPGDPVWIKEVPPFFGHEAAVLTWLAGHGHAAITPSLIASDGRRMLLDHIPGADLYGAAGPVRQAIAADMHSIQVGVDIAPLLDLGVPDRRQLGQRLTKVVVDHGGTDDPRLRALLAGLDDRLTRLADCGLPDTLVHGDLHPGNVLGHPDGPRVILDWGDSVIGNPALDILRLTHGLPADDAEAVQRAWAGWWRAAVPGCDPLRAIRLVRPLTELYYTSIYADFLANIESTERPYHLADIPDGLAKAAEAAAEAADTSETDDTTEGADVAEADGAAHATGRVG